MYTVYDIKFIQQEGQLCAQHCLNNLLQGIYLEDKYMYSCIRTLYCTFESAPFPYDCLVSSSRAQCWRLCYILTGTES